MITKYSIARKIATEALMFLLPTEHAMLLLQILSEGKMYRILTLLQVMKRKQELKNGFPIPILLQRDL